MSHPLTCLACGHSGPDVRMGLVEYSDPIPVEVALPTSYDGRGRVTGNVIAVVPGRYGSEWRCTDRSACDARQVVSAAIVDELRDDGRPEWLR